jgi:hypothetical protein
VKLVVRTKLCDKVSKDVRKKRRIDKGEAPRKISGG